MNFNSEEITIVSPKAAGVKGIKLKDDEVVKGLSLDESIEYLSIITDKNTAKRIKVGELEVQGRALKGSSLIKRVKSKPYNITKVLPTNIKNIIGLKMDTEIKGIKASDIPIMDLASTGSTISKQVVDDAFIVPTLIEKKLEEDTPKKEEIKQENVEKEELEELTIDDFLDDFKL